MGTERDFDCLGRQLNLVFTHVENRHEDEVDDGQKE